MSFYFNISTKEKVSYKNLKEQLKIPNVKFHWEPEDEMKPIEGAKIYLPNKSTRGITISKEEDSYSIGINVIASEEDFKLAVNTAKAIAELTDSKILPEDDDDAIPPDALLNKYNQDWIDSMKTLGTNLFIERIGQDGNLLSIGCCYMKYTVGPNIHQKLDASSELNYYNSLVAHVQKTQFFDFSKHQIPQVLVSTNQDGGNRKTYVVFYPHGAQFLSYADYVVFPAGSGKYEIPYSFIPLIADDKFKLIDETQFSIDALNEADYQKVIERIESELGKVSEESIKEKYEQCSKEELDDEFNRITSIPNARIKIFALQRMSQLIAEYEKRGIQMPNAKGKKEAQQQQPQQKPLAQSQSQHLKSPQRNKRTITKKPWWKFW